MVWPLQHTVICIFLLQNVMKRYLTMFTNQEYFNKHVKDLALILLSLLPKAVNGSKAIKGSI